MTTMKMNQDIWDEAGCEERPHEGERRAGNGIRKGTLKRAREGEGEGGGDILVYC